MPISAASSPIGPAPVTSKVLGCHARARWPMRSVWSQALARMLAGSSSTPRMPRARVDLDGEFRLDAEALGAVAVALLDAALGVASVAAHVPLAGGAGEARLRIGPAHDADDEVAGHQAATRRRRLDRAERFVAEHQARLAGRSKAVSTVEDFAVGAAHAECQRAHQYRAVRRGRLGDVVEPCRIGDAGRNGDCAHPFALDCLDSDRGRRADPAVFAAHSIPHRRKTPSTTPLRRKLRKVPADPKRKSDRARYRSW